MTPLGGEKQSQQAKTHPAAPLWFVPSLKPPHRVSREVIQLQLQRLKVNPTAVLQVALMGAFVACCLRAAAGQRRERGGLVNREEDLLTPPSGRGAEEETWQEGGAQAATKARTTAANSTESEATDGSTYLLKSVIPAAACQPFTLSLHSYQGLNHHNKDIVVM